MVRSLCEARKSVNFAAELRYFEYFRSKTFEELGVSEEIRRAIEELGFESPMPVQEEVIPYLLGNRNDAIALAQTGTGKTAAFGIPVLQKLDPKSRDTGAGAQSYARVVPADCRRPERLLETHEGSEHRGCVWRNFHREPNTSLAPRSTDNRCHSGTTHRPHAPRKGEFGKREQCGARRG